MLNIVIPDSEMFDEKTQEFRQIKGCSLQLEHSLVSISKWESKWEKPFLLEDKKTQEEFLDYIKCMTITQNVNPLTYMAMTSENLLEIANYIDKPMTATTFSSFGPKTPSKKQIVTSEIIYYQMIACNIPFECQKWHLNRLLTLIKVCSIKNQDPKKMKRSDALRRHQAINAINKAKYNTKG